MDSKMAIHPGEILKDEFLVPYRLSANKLAYAIGVPANRNWAIVNGVRGIAGETAALLGPAFSTTPEFWLNLQSRYALGIAASHVKRDSIRSADAFARELVHA